jgi:hypothetical protein
MARKSAPDYNPETHVLAHDGQLYERKFAQATGVAAGMHVKGQEKSPLNRRLEDAMTQAVNDAIAEGVNDPEEVRSRIHEARDRILAEDATEFVRTSLSNGGA